MRRKLPLGFPILLCCGLCFLCVDDAVVTSAEFKGDIGEELIWRLPLEQKLEKSVNLNFEAVPLTDVVDYFRQVLGINIVLDQRVEVEGERLITFQAADMRAADALKWIVTLAKLDYGYRNGAIYVSTPRSVRMAETAFFRIYDVRDLTRSAARGGRNGDDDDDDDDDEDDNGGRSSQWLVKLIVEMTGRENWRYVQVVGGGDDEDEFTSGADDF